LCLLEGHGFVPQAHQPSDDVPGAAKEHQPDQATSNKKVRTTATIGLMADGPGHARGRCLLSGANRGDDQRHEFRKLARAPGDDHPHCLGRAPTDAARPVVERPHQAAQHIAYESGVVSTTCLAARPASSRPARPADRRRRRSRGGDGLRHAHHRQPSKRRRLNRLAPARFVTRPSSITLGQSSHGAAFLA